MKDLEGRGLGIEVEGTWCGRWLCVDDIGLLGRDEKELKVMLDVMGEYAMKWRFRFNNEKRKTMLLDGKHSGEEV